MNFEPTRIFVWCLCMASRGLGRALGAPADNPGFVIFCQRRSHMCEFLLAGLMLKALFRKRKTSLISPVLCSKASRA